MPTRPRARARVALAACAVAVAAAAAALVPAGAHAEGAAQRECDVVGIGSGLMDGEPAPSKQPGGGAPMVNSLAAMRTKARDEGEREAADIAAATPPPRPISLAEAARSFTSDVRELAELVDEFLAAEGDGADVRFRALLDRRSKRERKMLSDVLDFVLQIEYMVLAFAVGAILLGGRSGPKKDKGDASDPASGGAEPEAGGEPVPLQTRAVRNASTDVAR